MVTLIMRGVVRQVSSQTHCLSFWQGFECAVDSDSTLCRQGEGIICLTLRGGGGWGWGRKRRRGRNGHIGNASDPKEKENVRKELK